MYYPILNIDIEIDSYFANIAYFLKSICLGLNMANVLSDKSNYKEICLHDQENLENHNLT